MEISTKGLDRKDTCTRRQLLCVTVWIIAGYFMCVMSFSELHLTLPQIKSLSNMLVISDPGTIGPNNSIQNMAETEMRLGKENFNNINAFANVSEVENSITRQPDEGKRKRYLKKHSHERTFLQHAFKSDEDNRSQKPSRTSRLDGSAGQIKLLPMSDISKSNASVKGAFLEETRNELNKGFKIVNRMLSSDNNSTLDMDALRDLLSSLSEFTKVNISEDMNYTFVHETMKSETFDDYLYVEGNTTPVSFNQSFLNSSRPKTEKDAPKTYLVTWNGLPHYISSRKKAAKKTFASCEYSNCKLSKNPHDMPKSDAIIFKARSLPKTLKFKRKPGQVWILYEHEAPITVHDRGNLWSFSPPLYKNAFNWTMTYDKQSADIFIPYGEFRKTETGPKERHYYAIAKKKTKDALIISSHCLTSSKRLEYIGKLRKFISVDILGACGRRWGCGKLYTHDKCFSFLNKKYRYYLAFENTFCRGYRTEKLYENFKYDIMLVTRGDIKGFVNDSNEPKNAFISAADFKSAEELGKYLKNISASPQTYADLLKKKSNYESIPYEDLYERALCDICKRMNNQETYHKQITDLNAWRDIDNTCYDPPDISIPSLFAARKTKKLKPHGKPSRSKRPKPKLKPPEIPNNSASQHSKQISASKNKKSRQLPDLP